MLFFPLGQTHVDLLTFDRFVALLIQLLALHIGNNSQSIEKKIRRFNDILQSSLYRSHQTDSVV